MSHGRLLLRHFLDAFRGFYGPRLGRTTSRRSGSRISARSPLNTLLRYEAVIQCFPLAPWPARSSAVPTTASSRSIRRWSPTSTRSSLRWRRFPTTLSGHAFAEGDKRHYFLPCPHCGTLQTLKWSQMRWPGDDRAKAFYVCEHCGESISEREKQSMVAQGEWRSTAAGDGKTASFHISALYSPFVSWGEIAREHEACGNDPAAGSCEQHRHQDQSPSADQHDSPLSGGFDEGGDA